MSMFTQSLSKYSTQFREGYFNFFRIWTSATPQPIQNDIWQSLGLHLVNINAYAKFYKNIPNGLRVIDIFRHFSWTGRGQNLHKLSSDKIKCLIIGYSIKFNFKFQLTFLGSCNCWAKAWQNKHLHVHAKQRLRLVCASAQSDQSSLKKIWVLNYPHKGCPGWSESSLGAQVSWLVLSCCGSANVFCSCSTIKWAASWQNQHNDCAPSDDSDQPGHPPSLIRAFAVRSVGS